MTVPKIFAYGEVSVIVRDAVAPPEEALRRYGRAGDRFHRDRDHRRRRPGVPGLHGDRRARRRRAEYPDGRGTIERCDISAVDGAAVAVEDDGAVRLFHTTVHDSPGVGVHVAGGTPTIQDCDIRAVGGHGLVLSGTADAAVTRVRLDGTAGHGILIAEQAVGRFTDFWVGGADAATVAITGTAAPQMTGGTIIGGDDVAVLYDDRATGLLRKTTVIGAKSGVVVSGTAGPELEDLTIRDCAEYGLRLAGQAPAPAAPAAPISHPVIRRRRC